MLRFQDAFNQLDQCLKERMRAFHTPALSMALTDRDQLVRLSSLGSASLATHVPLQQDHLFAIGSVGKSFTAVAMLQLSEQGRVDLSAPVKTYLPWFEVQSQYEPITLHHLLTHSAGLPRGTDFSPSPRSEVFALRCQETGFAPGTHFSYSDAGYKTLGLVIEAVTGQPYAQWIQEKILQPLGMNHTYAVTTTHLRTKMAAGYRDVFDDRPAHVSHPLVSAYWVETDSGDGCIVSNAADMAKFARMLLNGGAGPDGPIISPASYQKMVEPMIQDDGETYSYGLYLFEDDGIRVAGHGGDTPGYQAYMWLDLDNGLGSVVLMTEPYTPRASFLTLDFFRAAYLGENIPDTPPLPDFTHVSAAADYAGTYQSGSCAVTFEAEGHHLFLLANGQRVVLEQRSPHCFYANYPDWNLYLLRFVQNAEGQVVEVSYGPQWFVNSHYNGPVTFDAPPEWTAFIGHYRSHNPWATNFRVFERKGQLFLCEPTGEEEVLVELSNCNYRIGEEDYIPERLRFDQFVEGQAQRAVRSGAPYYRFFTP